MENPKDNFVRSSPIAACFFFGFSMFCFARFSAPSHLRPSPCPASSAFSVPSRWALRWSPRSIEVVLEVCSSSFRKLLFTAPSYSSNRRRRTCQASLVIMSIEKDLSAEHSHSMAVVGVKHEAFPQESQAFSKCVYVSREDVLRQALKDLSLEIHEIRTCVIGKDQIIASVCINAPTIGEYSMLHHKKIFGDYKLTVEAALESARLAALLHLQKIGVIYVDDINLGEVAKCEAKLAACQRELVTATACATMFQEEAVCMKAQLDSICTKDEKLVATTKESSVKKEEFIPQQANIKKEVSDAQSSTPPPSDRHINTRASIVKRKAPRMQLTM